MNHYAGSDDYGMEYRPYYLAREWTRAGHEVTIVAATFSHLRNHSPSARAGREEMVDGIRYVWIPTPTYEGNGVRRFLNILAFVTQLLLRSGRLARRYLPDVVVASSTYPLDNVPAARIARKSKAAHVYEVHDLWPLTLIEVGGMPRRHPFVVLLQWAEDWSYQRADAVISMLPKAEDHMTAHGMDPGKSTYVPNGIVVSDWQAGEEALPTEHREQLTALHSDRQFVVGYAGGHGAANSLETLIQSATLLQDDPVQIVLVGGGPDKAGLQAAVERLELPNVTFLPPVRKPAIPKLLESMDACYLGAPRQPIYRFGVNPNKLFDYMMARRPVIQGIDAGNDLVADVGCGVSIPPEDPEALAEAIRTLMQLPASSREAMGERGRTYVVENHDYRVLADLFLDVVRDLRES